MKTRWLITSSLSPRPLLSNRHLQGFGTVDTSKGWDSQVCSRAIGGITLDKHSESCHL